jgi:adenylate kinase
LGKLAQQYMDEGKLVPDQVVIDMVDDKIKNDAQVKGYIFDGFPRTVAQAEALDKLMNGKGTPISCMISLEVPKEELVKRLLNRGLTSGRTDDQDEKKINTRIQVYLDETLPVATYYQQQGKLNALKGVGTIEEIFTSICKVLDQHI